MWERLLRAINYTSNEFQLPNLDLSVASGLLNCPISDKELLWNSSESVRMTASALASYWCSSLEFTRKVKCFFDELS